MSNLREALELIRGVKPTPDKINRMTAFAHMLDIPTNDVMFPIVVSQLMMHDEIDEKLKSFLEALKTSTNITKEDLVKAVSDGAIEVADTTAIKQKWQWAAGCIIVACVSFGLVGWQSYNAGVNSGIGTGYTEAKDEKAAAAWANTPEGRSAYRLASSGELQKLIRCTGKGWEITNGVCYVHSVPNEGIYGWTLP